MNNDLTPALSDHEVMNMLQKEHETPGYIADEVVDNIACPNCKALSIPCGSESGLLADWCNVCDKSIFDGPTREDCWDGDGTENIPC